MAVIARMISIPFNDPDFTAPGLPVATITRSMGGHRYELSSVAVLADGRFVTGSGDKTVKVWKETSPRSGAWSVETLWGEAGVNCVAVLPDGPTKVRFVTGGWDNTVKVWKETSPGSGVWNIEATLRKHTSAVFCVAVLPDGRLITGSGDKTVNVWTETSPGSNVWNDSKCLWPHSYRVWSVAVLADGRFVTGGDDYYDRNIRVYKELVAESFEAQWSVEATLTGHSGYVRCVAVLQDGPTKVRFVTGSSDKTVKVWQRAFSIVDVRLSGALRRPSRGTAISCVAWRSSRMDASPPGVATRR